LLHFCVGYCSSFAVVTAPLSFRYSLTSNLRLPSTTFIVCDYAAVHYGAIKDDLLRSVQVQGTFTRKFSIASLPLLVPLRDNLSLPSLLLLHSLHHPSLNSSFLFDLMKSASICSICSSQQSGSAPVCVSKPYSAALEGFILHPSQSSLTVFPTVPEPPVTILILILRI